jgi:hypothetical protein
MLAHEGTKAYANAFELIHRRIGRSGSPVGLPLPRRIFQGRNNGRQRPRRDSGATTQNIAPPSHAF